MTRVKANPCPLGCQSRPRDGLLAAEVLAMLLNACMSVAITVRDVPDQVRDELAARAARAGMSLQEYLRRMLVESAARPSVDDVIARARGRVGATGVRVDAKSILAARDADRRCDRASSATLRPWSHYCWTPVPTASG